jgi:hypothetical protein
MSAGNSFPWAQEAERIGVPAPHHGGVQAEAKHAMSAMSPLKSREVDDRCRPERSPSPHQADDHAGT